MSVELDFIEVYCVVAAHTSLPVLRQELSELSQQLRTLRSFHNGLHVPVARAYGISGGIMRCRFQRS